MFIIAHVGGVVCIYVCVLVKFRYQYLLASLVILHFIVGRSSFADPRLEDFIQTLWLTSPGDSPASASFSIVLYLWLFPGILFIWAQVFSLKRLPAEPSPYLQSDTNAYYMAPSVASENAVFPDIRCLRSFQSLFSLYYLLSFCEINISNFLHFLGHPRILCLHALDVFLVSSLTCLCSLILQSSHSLLLPLLNFLPITSSNP